MGAEKTSPALGRGSQAGRKLMKGAGRQHFGKQNSNLMHGAQPARCAA